MQIKNIKLLNYRNYSNLEIDFHESLNIISGNNGVGKTNLVEAIYVLALSRSFRASNDKYLLMHGKTVARIEGDVINRHTNNYKIILGMEGKKVKINNNKITKISDYISKINIILFHPNDLKIIKDTPQLRRKMLNIDISQLKLAYLRNLDNYNKLLKQRNALLKKNNTLNNDNLLFLEVLDEKLIDYGLKVHSYRQEFILEINNYISTIYQQIAKTGDLKVKYESDYYNKDFSTLKQMYKNSLEKDLLYRKTNLGIHADDFSFYLNEKNLKYFGSEGQQKNAVISWKFAEIEIFNKEKGNYPILILDDLFSELDKNKIEQILLLINKDIQTFITTANIDNLNNIKLSNYKKITIDEEHNMEVSVYE